jgi:hypothetical protein
LRATNHLQIFFESLLIGCIQRNPTKGIERANISPPPAGVGTVVAFKEIPQRELRATNHLQIFFESLLIGCIQRNPTKGIERVSLIGVYIGFGGKSYYRRI